MGRDLHHGDTENGTERNTETQKDTDATDGTQREKMDCGCNGCSSSCCDPDSFLFIRVFP